MQKMPFNVYARQLKTGTKFYVRFRDLDTGELTVAQSVEKVRERINKNDYSPICKKNIAEMYCYKALELGVAFSSNSDSRGNTITLEEYILSFWDYDNSSYIIKRNRIKPNSIGRGYVMAMRSLYLNHAKPILKDIRLCNVKTKHLEKILDSMIKEGKSNSTVKKARLALSIPLGEAFRLGLINNDPSIKLSKISNYTKNKRDIISETETLTLLKTIQRLYKSNRLDSNQYYSILVALHSGMRLGEIRALNIDDISISEEIAKINISHGLDERNHLKCTKGKESREVIINTTLARDLITLGSLNPLNTGVVFWSNRQNKETSGFITTKYIENGFYMALKEMGIDEKTRQEKGIVFHSLRHLFTTLVVNGADLRTAQKLDGHKQATTTLNYFHKTQEYLIRGYQAINKVIPYKPISRVS